MATGTIRIVLIAEDPAQGEALKALLAEISSEEYALQRVATLEEALDLLRSRSFHCAIVDLGPDAGTGAEAARAVRDQEQDVPVVVLANSGDESVALDLLRLDIQDYLIKGEISSASLARTIRKSMRRKRGLDALSASEERLRFASEAAEIGTWHWDLGTDRLTWSERCKALFGYPPEHQMTYRCFLDAIHPDDRARIDAAVRQSLQDGTEYSVEMRILLPNRQARWVMSKGRAFYDDRGKAVHMHGIALDITSRKRAEEERERLLLQLDSVLESVAEGVAIADLQGNVVRMNAAAQELHQSKSEAEVQQNLEALESIFELTLPDGSRLPFEQWPLVRAVRGEQLRNFEVRLRRKDTGWSRILSYNGTPVRTKSGEIILAVSTIRDVTEQKQAVEALRVSEEKFAKIFTAAPSLIVITTLREGIILDVNRSALEALGYRREEILGRSVLELEIWEDVADRDRILQQLKAHGSLRGYEARFRGKDARTIAGLYSGEIVDIGGTLCILSVVSDITERKRAEEAMLRAKEEWERTFDSVPDFIAILDKDNRVVRVNRAMADRLGLKPEECVGMPCYTAFHGTDTPPEFCPHLRGALSGKEIVEMYELHLSRHFLVSNTPLLAPDGRKIGAVHVARDISERKAAEQKIELLNAQLAARAAELEAANRELETFNYSVAHDLRQPLNMLYGYCQAVEMLCGERLDDQCHRFLQESYGVVARMNVMIEALLNFSRLGRVELHRESVDLSAMARAVAGELLQSAPGRNIRFRVAEGVVGHGDPTLLRNILENLMGNAWKYTPQQGEALIEFGAAERDGQTTYFVRDNGQGFDMAQAEKLFVPFQRLPGSDGRSGFGIGLATVERIVQRHGGKIWAESEPGQGATFYFTLGAATAEIDAGHDAPGTDAAIEV